MVMSIHYVHPLYTAPIVNPGGLCDTAILCENDGTCEDRNSNQFICHCQDGYSGTFCEIEPAVTVPQTQGMQTK